MADQDMLSQRHGLEAVAMSSSGPQMESDEQLQVEFENIQLLIGDSNDLGDGNLFITTRKVVWAQAGSQDGLGARFLAISLHAVAQSQSETRKSCIYIQWEPFGSLAGSESEDEEACHELRFLPQDQSLVSKIFDHLSHAAALNPDDSEEDDEEGEFFYNEEEALQAGGLDEDMLDHLDTVITMPTADELGELLAEDPERFEDPDEDEEQEDHHQHGHANGHNHQ